MRPRLALDAVLAVGLGLMVVDLVAADNVARALGGLLVDPAHQLRDAHVVLRTGATVAVVGWAFGRFGWMALMATPLLIGPLFLGALPPVTGDEPHYLMIAVSLEHDQDFAVADNYARGDGAPFGYPELGPSPGHPKDSPQSLHYPGSALLALPGWLFGGRRGALLGVAVLGALLIHEMVRMCRALGARAGPAGLAVAMVTFTAPVLLMMRQLYPDIPGALCLAHLARRLAEGDREPGASRFPGLAPLTAAGAAAAAPWLHARLLPGVVLLVAVLAVRQPRMRLLPPLALAATLGLLGVAFERWYGSPLPNAPYSDFPVRGTSPLRGLVGMFADSHAGLVATAPVLVVGLVALPALWRSSQVWLLTVGAVVGTAVAQNAAFTFWHAGFSTPARPWAALLPLGTPLVALAVERIPRVTAAVGAATAALAVALLALPPLSYPTLAGLTGLWHHFRFSFLPVIDSGGRASHIGNTPVPACAAALFALAAVLAVASWALWFRRPGTGAATGAGWMPPGEDAAPAISR